MFKFFLILIFFSVFASCQASNIWKAIDLFEKGEFQESAQIFQNHMEAPIARPYCQYLKNNDYLDKPLPSLFFPDNKYHKKYKQCFDTSFQILKGNRVGIYSTNNMKQIRKNECAVREKLTEFTSKDISSASAFYALGTIFYKGLFGCPPHKKIAFDSLANGVSFGEYRSVLKMKEYFPDKISKIENLSIDFFCCLLNRTDNIADNLFYIAELTKPGSKLEEKKLSAMLYKQSAALGHFDAQMKVAQNFSVTEEEILFWFSLAAQKGSLEALTFIASSFERGVRGLPKDVKKAFELYSQIAEKAEQSSSQNPTPFYNMGVVYMKGLGTIQNTTEALRFFRKAAELGDSVAQLEMGISLCKKEDRECLEWFEKSANQGNILAKNSLGRLYLSGKFVDVDIAKGINLCFEDAFNGNIISQLNIIQAYSTEGNRQLNEKIKCHPEEIQNWAKAIIENTDLSNNKRSRAALYLYQILKDIVPEKNLSLSISYLKKSIELGNVEALYQLGRLHEYGIGVSEDSSLAISYIQQALQKGHLLGRAPLGYIYMNKKEGWKYENDRIAISLFQEVLNKEETPAFFQEEKAIAAYNLSVMHIEKRGGLDQNPVKIFNFLTCSEEAGDQDAPALLGLLYKNGFFGFEKDEKKAAKYLSSADDNTLSKAFFTIAASKIRLGDDFSEIISSLEEASRLGNDAAIFQLFLMYHFGVEGYVEENQEKAENLRKFMPLQLQFFIESALQQTFNTSENIISKEESAEPEEYLKPVVDLENLTVVEEKDTFIEEKKEVVAVESNKKEERFIKKLSKLKGKKQIKWRKMKSLLGKAMDLQGGYIKSAQGGGSGHNFKIGNTYSSLHVPHGKDAAELKGGRLKSVMNLVV